MIPELLEILSEYKIKATFFITGKILKTNKKLVSDLKDMDHELALHGYNHNIWQGINNDKIKDVKKAINIYEKIIGEKPKGFRAPYGNIDSNIINILERYEFKYDSSIIPNFYRMGGNGIIFQPTFVNAPLAPYNPSEKNIIKKGEMRILEIPFSILPIVKLPMGLSYMLLAGLNFYKYFMKFFKGELIIFYLHPYELFNKSFPLNFPSLIRLYYKTRIDPIIKFKNFLSFMKEDLSANFIKVIDI